MFNLYLLRAKSAQKHKKNSCFLFHINDHCTDPLATVFKMSYTRACTYIFIGCMAAGAAQIHAIHIRGKACIFSERAQSDYSNLFWIFGKNQAQEHTGQRTEGPWCHLVGGTRDLKVLCAHN